MCVGGKSPSIGTDLQCNCHAYCHVYIFMLFCIECQGRFFVFIFSKLCELAAYKFNSMCRYTATNWNPQGLAGYILFPSPLLHSFLFPFLEIPHRRSPFSSSYSPSHTSANIPGGVDRSTCLGQQRRLSGRLEATSSIFRTTSGFGQLEPTSGGDALVFG